MGSGSLDASGAISEGAASSSGVDACFYAQFDTDTVSVAVAESFSGMKKAEEFLSTEFSDFDTLHRSCYAAWQQILSRVELEGTENSKRMAYTDVREVKIDAKIYPCYVIPARRLVLGVKIELEMGSDPTLGLGTLYIGSSDGWVLDAELVSDSQMKCTVETPLTEPMTQVYSRTQPVKVMINGCEDSHWAYDTAKNTTTVRTVGKVEIEILLK